ncbi:6723_t:CDS:2 [Entrophospora sp. SA101]|nr:6723_t:CDS:2 [Entrophospora sp. SA101]
MEEDGSKSPTAAKIAEEIQAKAEEVKKTLKHVETKEKNILPTAEANKKKVNNNKTKSYCGVDGDGEYCTDENYEVTEFFEKEYDPCEKIHLDYLKKRKHNLKLTSKYQDVKDCYYNFPYNHYLAKETIETLKKILDGFYIFLEQSNEPPVPGFNFTPTNLINDLKLLSKKNYTYDIDVMMDLVKSFYKISDAHLAFVPICYTSFVFEHGLSLYSVINVNGTQVIKVFDDIYDASNIDCEVSHIDDEPALEVLTNYAYKNVFRSRDLGVRFNRVLSNLVYKNGHFITSNFNQLFTRRSLLPESPIVTYTLKCHNYDDNQLTLKKKIKRHWIAMSSRYDDFKDSQSYWENVCVKANQDEMIDDETLDKAQELTLAQSYDHYDIGHGELVYKGQISGYYMVDDIGVAVVPSLSSVNGMTEKDMMEEILNGFQVLEQGGAQKLVLDFSNNRGGSISVANFFNDLLFPETHPNFPNDMKLSKQIMAAFKVAHSLPEIKMIFSTQYLLGYDTKKPFKNLKELFGNNLSLRGNQKVRYTSKFIDSYVEKSMNEILPSSSSSSDLNVDFENYHKNYKKYSSSMLPWNSTNIIIITNGVCGSSCALITQHLSEVHNVKTVAVGGFVSQKLSYSSFPGGAVYSEKLLHKSLKRMGLYSNPIFPMPFLIKAKMSFPIREVYSIKHKNKVLDFLFSPANYRLYYDEENVRDPSKLWVEAAKFL